MPRERAGHASISTLQNRGRPYQRTDGCLKACLHDGRRMAVTKKVRGTPGTERGTTGNGQRPKCAPSSPGWTTVARQPHPAKKVSGWSMLEIQRAPSLASNSIQERAWGDVSISVFLNSHPIQLPLPTGPLAPQTDE